LKKVILASASPRRIEIIKKLGLEFEIMPSNVSEKIDDFKNPLDVSMSIAFQKTYDIAKDNKEHLVIGADTIVYCEKIMGKPSSRSEAFDMLRFLSGKCHSVITGISVMELEQDKKIVDYDMTKVKFKKLTDKTINNYLDTEEYIDKAGSYAIQGKGELLVDFIEGSYSNVVGLSVQKLSTMLEFFEISLL
jgi:septum formation protein